MRSCESYFWQVRVWDQHNVASAWSPVGQWTMAVLDVLEWRAQWITSPIMENVHEPRNIVGWKRPAKPNRHSRIFYRVTFTCASSPCFYRIFSAIGGRGTAYLNGVRIMPRLNRRSMECFIGHDQPRLKTGLNVLAIEVNPRPRGELAAGVTCIMPGGQIETIPLDNWKYNTTPGRGWRLTTFNDSHWPACARSYPFGRQPWATPDMNFDSPRRSFMLRREFAAHGTVRRAVAMVSGLGAYEMRINGQKVGHQFLSPNWTQYARRIEYDMFDVTALLRSGTNCIGAILGNSWWSSGLGPAQSWRAAKRGENLKWFCQLHLHYTDGSHQVICSDGNWMVHPSPIVADSIYNGEFYDARLEQPGWDQPHFDAANWFSAQSAPVNHHIHLSPRADEPIQITETLTPRAMIEPVPGIYVLDFGQNHAGVTQLNVQQTAGTKITLRHAESIYPNGRVDTRNLQSASATDVYICRGGDREVWMPRFTYHGYRYVEVHGLARRPQPNDFSAMVLGTAARHAAAFSSSKTIYNRVAAMTQWSQRSNTVSVPTDCPQRDSRVGSLGDASAFVRTACWNQSLPAFYRKWARDMADAAHIYAARHPGPAGRPTLFAPTMGNIRHGYPGWADAVGVIPYTNFIFNGDLLGLVAAYPLISAWASYIVQHLRGGIFIHPAFDDSMALTPTPPELVSAAMACRSMQIAAKAARWTNPIEAAHWDTNWRQMVLAFNARFLNRLTLQYGNGSQCSNILPLAFDLVPHWACRSVVQNIVQDIAARGGRISTGYMASPHLLPVLSRFGHIHLAAQLLSDVQYPSLGYMAEKGCTTVAERWDFNRHGPHMNSLNHTVFGSLTAWLYESLAGITPDEDQPGFAHFFVRPFFPVDMTHLHLEHLSPRGLIACRWQRRRRSIDMQLLIPPGASARIYFAHANLAGITADGQPIYHRGRAVSAPNFKAMAAQTGRAIYEAGAGDWHLKLLPLTPLGS